MKKRTLVTITGVALAALALTIINVRPHVQAAPNPTPALAPNFISAAGRVEPISEEVKIGSELNGKLRQVLVDESDHVHRGQVLAVLNNDDYSARIAISPSRD